MYLKSLELSGFKSFAKKSELEFVSPIAAIVGPNGSGKSNIAEAFRFVLGEQSLKSMRTKRGEDLIWGGSQSVPRGSRASVTVVFDNTSRLFDIDFDEVSIERVVHRDGVNQYLINGSNVRLKDVAELLAGANIGSSGHHIISQGEADRLLSASVRDRREMIEDALGLKIFQYKKKESEKKLDQTEENIKQVMSLRKEIAPHLRFLKRQVEKIEKSKQMREELVELLRDYLKREDVYISGRKKDIALGRREPQEKLSRLEAELAEARTTLEKTSAENTRSKAVLEVEQELSGVRRKRDELSRKVGRLEGQIAFAEKHVAKTSDATVPLSAVRSLTEDIEEVVASASANDSLEKVLGGLKRVRMLITSFFDTHKEQGSREDASDVDALKAEKEQLDREFGAVEKKEAELSEAYKKLQEELEESREEGRDAERAVFRLTAEKNKVESILRDLSRDEEILFGQEAEFKRDLEEGAVLAGRAVLQYQDVSLDERVAGEEARSEQEARKRKVEKLKIRVEEAGGGSSEEVLKEYQEASERDEFLEREVTDLEASAEALKQIIVELDEKLAAKFREGITKINKEFQHFFEILFDGGSASLIVIEQKKRKRTDALLESGGDEGEEEETEAGIDISVSLPRKKVKGLQMLSGGERALTSIALLFAMSQVNPPPFLILDETEAALDEANSRKYGSMIKELAQKTQLILITHNRETMSVAGVLYGVTMGSDGISKLLSVKFDEAVQVAK